MTAPEIDSRLAPALAAAQRLLEQYNSRGVIIGGVAVGLLAKPRFTSRPLLPGRLLLRMAWMEDDADRIATAAVLRIGLTLGWRFRGARFVTCPRTAMCGTGTQCVGCPRRCHYGADEQQQSLNCIRIADRAGSGDR